MKKVILMTIFGTLLTINAHAKTVATCDSYQLEQSSATTYFAGIAHTENEYQLTKSGQESILLNIETNSEGAILKSNAGDFEITAMWDTFELILKKGSSKYFINCKTNEKTRKSIFCDYGGSPACLD